jgi:hypothetical protein
MMKSKGYIQSFLKHTEKLNISGVIDRFFHKCDFKTIEIPSSNKKGEIWIQECKCGKKQRVLFDDKGRCRDIKPL